MRPTALTATLATLATLAIAQPARADDVAARPLAEPAAPATSDSDGPKSAELATGLAVGGSLVGPALVAVAVVEGHRYDGPLHAAFWPMMVAGGATMIVGPSLGNWYAGKRFSTGLALRLGGAAVSALGGTLYATSVFGSAGETGVTAGALVFLAGAGVMLGGTVADIVSAPDAAADYNRRHRGVSLSLAPIVTRRRGEQQTGLAVVGTF